MIELGQKYNLVFKHIKYILSRGPYIYYLRVQMIKDWLLGKVAQSKIPNFAARYHELLKYNSVSFIYDGVRYEFSKKDIKAKVQCQQCCQLRMEVEALKAQLEVKQETPMRVLVQRWLDRKFIRTQQRVMPRRKLLRAANEFLSQYNVSISPDLWEYIVKDLLKDTSTQYRKFKLQEKL